MPWSRPSLKELVSSAETTIATALGLTVRPQVSNWGILARVVAGATHGLYGYLGWLSRQLLPDTAETAWLERHASIWGLQRSAASRASGQLTVTGASGAILPQGTLFRRSDGQRFATTADLTIPSSGTGSVAITASTGGTSGNSDGGITLTLVTSQSGIATTATIGSDGLSGGTDAESDDSLRSRLLTRLRRPPQGGCADDYLAWAREVAGVTRAWVYPGWAGSGTVGLAFVCDELDDPIPTATMRTTVKEWVDAKRPVTAHLEVIPLTAQPITVVLSSLTPNTSLVRTAIETNLRDLLARESAPGATVLISHIREAISQATGETDHVLVSPTANITLASTAFPVFGTLTVQ